MINIQKAIVDAMNERTQRIVEEEAAAAAERVKTRVRGLAGQVATTVCSFVTYEQVRNELRITVKLPEKAP